MVNEVEKNWREVAAEKGAERIKKLSMIFAPEVAIKGLGGDAMKKVEKIKENLDNKIDKAKEELSAKYEQTKISMKDKYEELKSKATKWKFENVVNPAKKKSGEIQKPFVEFDIAYRKWKIERGEKNEEKRIAATLEFIQKTKEMKEGSLNIIEKREEQLASFDVGKRALTGESEAEKTTERVA
jgi:hypothetical protein